MSGSVPENTHWDPGYTPAEATFIVANLPAIASKTHGFSTNGAIFLSLDGELDPILFVATATGDGGCALRLDAVVMPMRR